MTDDQSPWNAHQGEYTMISRTLTTAATLTALSLGTTALAGGPATGLVDFEDAEAFFGPGPYDLDASGLGTFYSGLGMTMSSSERIYIGNGVSQGDFGFFQIEGTFGPSFLAIFDDLSDGGTLTYTFDRPVDFLVDLILTGVLGEDELVCTVTTSNKGVLVDHEIIMMPTPVGDPDGQSFFRRFDGADTFQFQIAPGTHRVLGFDFIEWQEVGCGVADINGDGFIDFIDISAFLGSYEDGCIEP